MSWIRQYIGKMCRSWGIITGVGWLLLVVNEGDMNTRLVLNIATGVLITFGCLLEAED